MEAENTPESVNFDSYFTKRFLGIVIILVLLAASLLLYNIFSGTIGNGMRDFIAEQGIWAKSQKTAVINLMYYTHSGNENKFTDYQQEMRKLQMDDKAIDTLKNNSSTKVDSLFSPLLSNLKTDGFKDLKTFVSVYSSPALSSIMPSTNLFKQAFKTREKAEDKLSQIQRLAHSIKEAYRDGPLTASKKKQYLEKLYRIDRQLTPLAHHFTYDLSNLSRSLTHFTRINLLIIGVFALIVGGYSSGHYLTKLQKWKSKLIRSNKKFESSKKTYEDLFNNVEDGIILQDKDGKFITANPAAGQMFGYTNSEMIGKTPEDIIAPESWEDSQNSDFFTKALSGERNIFERWAQKKDGDTFPIEIALSKGQFYDRDVVIAIIRDITTRQEFVNELQQANQRNQVLLNEIHHRVKNNMALISGLLQLQAFDINDPTLQSILLQSQSRVQAIADVHEHLYQSQNLVNINFKSYLETFSASFNDRLASGAGINIKTDSPSFSLNVNQALPTALLLNEILIHITEYHLTGKGKEEIKIRIEIEHGQVKFDIGGMSKREKQYYQTESQLGLEIIQNLTEQLDADFEASSNGNFQYSFTFEHKEELKGGGSNI